MIQLRRPPYDVESERADAGRAARMWVRKRLGCKGGMWDLSVDRLGNDGHWYIAKGTLEAVTWTDALSVFPFVCLVELRHGRWWTRRDLWIGKPSTPQYREYNA